MAEIQFGLMIRGQFPQEEDMRIRFDEMVEQVRLIDKLGFASLTKGMHYSSSPMQVLNQMVFHSRMAAETKTLDITLVSYFLLCTSHLKSQSN